MNKISERNIIYGCMQNIFIIIVMNIMNITDSTIVLCAVEQWNAIALWWQYFDEVAVGGSNNIFPLALLTLCNISCIHAIIVEKEPFRTFQVRRRVKEVNVECSLSGNIYVMYAYFIGSFYMDIPYMFMFIIWTTQTAFYVDLFSYTI